MLLRILVPSYLIHIVKVNLLHSEQILLQLEPRIAFIDPSRATNSGNEEKEKASLGTGEERVCGEVIVVVSA